MKRKMLFGVVRDRVTGDTFDIGVAVDGVELARNKLAQTPNLELLLDAEQEEAPSSAPGPQTSANVPEIVRSSP